MPLCSWLRGLTAYCERRRSSMAEGKRRSGSQPGNRNAVKHGAEARVPAERLSAKVQEVYGALAEEAPVRGPDGGLPTHDRAVVMLLARARCRLDDVTVWLDEHGTFNRNGRLRIRVLDQEQK